MTREQYAARRDELADKIGDLLREYQDCIGPSRSDVPVNAIAAAYLLAVEYVIVDNDDQYYIGHIVPPGQLATTSRGLAEMIAGRWSGR